MATISNNDIARAIYLVSKDTRGAEESAIVKKIVQFLSRKHLLGKTKDILAQLSKIINKESAVVVADVSSAKELDGKTKKELSETLAKRYSAKEVVISSRLDESLLGGFRIEINDEVIDLTLKNKVSKLQEYLTRRA